MDPREQPGLEREQMLLARLRSHRQRPTPDLGIASALERIERTTRRRSQAEAEAARAWREVFPEDASTGSAEVVGIRSRVLTVRVSDHSVRWRVEEWLRAGGQAALRAEARTAIARVKVVQ